MIYETDAQLQDDLAFYQKLLRLSDWDIKAKIVRGHEFGGDNQKMATIERLPQKKMAIIKIRSHLDYDGTDQSEAWSQDDELSLCHELMHIHECEFSDEVCDADETLFNRLWTQRERLVHLTARALVTLRRQIPSAPELVAEKDKWVRGYNGPIPTLTCQCGFSVEMEPGQVGKAETEKIKREHVCNGVPSDE